MKYSLIIFSTLLILSACKSVLEPAPVSGVEGTWQLIEMLMDPGDGSGTFQAINSDATITLDSNGTFQANFDLCSMQNTAGQASSGNYSITDQTISPSLCSQSIPFPISYSLNQNELILSFPCIEACQHKYQRLD